MRIISMNGALLVYACILRGARGASLGATRAHMLLLMCRGSVCRDVAVRPSKLGETASHDNALMMISSFGTRCVAALVVEVLLPHFQQRPLPARVCASPVTLSSFQPTHPQTRKETPKMRPLALLLCLVACCLALLGPAGAGAVQRVALTKKKLSLSAPGRSRPYLQGSLQGSNVPLHNFLDSQVS